MRYANIHCHMLYGVDDGAKDPETMVTMIDHAYKNGVREICMTPHYNPAMFHCPVEVILRRFNKAKAIAAEKYPDLNLYLGQEMYYYHDSVNDLLDGKCLTLNRTRNVLVEFGPCDDKSSITYGVSRLLTSGFIPVVAHVERYEALRNKNDCVRDLKNRGAYIQVNAATVLGDYGFIPKLRVMSLIKQGLVDIVADDCHDLTDKKPCLGEAYESVKRKFGRKTAEMLFVTNPMKILHGL